MADKGHIIIRSRIITAVYIYITRAGARRQVQTVPTRFGQRFFFLEILFAFIRQRRRPLSHRARLTGFQINTTRSGPTESLFQLFNTLLLKKIHPKGEINKRFIYDRSGWKFLAKRTKRSVVKKKNKKNILINIYLCVYHECNVKMQLHYY